MNRLFYLLLAALVALGLAACGSDDPSPGTDNGDSPSGDTEDSGPSDENGDTDSDTGDNGDTTIDPCDDIICDGNEYCVDGACIPGDTPDCPTAAELNCGAGTTYVGCACIDNVDPEDYVFSGLYSYINSIIMPDANDEDAECCFDLNRNGEIDNALGTLLPTIANLAGDLDLNAVLEEALEDDSFALLVEYRDIESDLSYTDSFGMSIWIASDASGEEDPFDSWGARSSGDGVFNISADGFGEAGSQVQFNNAELDGSTLSAGPSTFLLSLDLGELTDGLLDALVLEITGARLVAEVEAHANGIATINETINTIEYGGGKLGGAVDVEQILGLVDNLARECTCAGIDPDRALVLSYIEDDELVIECDETQDWDGDCSGDDGLICENISIVCGVAPNLIAGLVDVDTDGNGVDNGISVGLRLGMTGASLADPPVEF